MSESEFKTGHVIYFTTTKTTRGCDTIIICDEGRGNNDAVRWLKGVSEVCWELVKNDTPQWHRGLAIETQGG